MLIYTNVGTRLERGVDRVIKLRNLNMVLYRECKIPTDWLLDSGMVCKVWFYLNQFDQRTDEMQINSKETATFNGR